ncbi:MAG: hypothetical protein AAGF53_07245 [Pseudomonadota bacterium]
MSSALESLLKIASWSFAVLVSLVAIGVWLLRPGPLVSEGFPKSLLEDFLGGQPVVVREYVPDVQKVCIVGGYESLDGFLTSHGVESDLNIETGESDFAFFVERPRQDWEYAVLSYPRHRTTSTYNEYGCYLPDDHVFVLKPYPNRPKSEDRRLSIAVREAE